MIFRQTRIMHLWLIKGPILELQIILTKLVWSLQICSGSITATVRTANQKTLASPLAYHLKLGDFAGKTILEKVEYDLSSEDLNILNQNVSFDYSFLYSHSHKCDQSLRWNGKGGGCRQGSRISRSKDNDLPIKKVIFIRWNQDNQINCQHDWVQLN